MPRENLAEQRGSEMRLIMHNKKLSAINGIEGDKHKRKEGIFSQKKSLARKPLGMNEPLLFALTPFWVREDFGLRVPCRETKESMSNHGNTPKQFFTPLQISRATQKLIPNPPADTLFLILP
ncbi:hypothetical protein TNCT_670571, partial [Trichonephila clavata]